MPAITSLDLSNAKLDVDHIADIATSSLPTATDRLGNTKDTISGAVYKIAAFTNRGAWTSSTAYNVKDLVSVSGTWYVAVVAHTSSSSFSTDSSTKWRVYQGVILGDLAASSGASLVGFDDTLLDQQIKSRIRRVASNIASLRLIDKNKYNQVSVSNYSSAGDAGGGDYYLDSGDTTSSDNGCTVIVAADGGRWKLINNGTIHIAQWGNNLANAIDFMPIGGTLLLGSTPIVGNVTKTRSDLKIVGVGMPTYKTGLDGLVGGSIIQGTLRLIGDRLSFQDFGMDCGSVVCAAINSGNAMDGLVVLDATRTIRKNITAKNLICIVKDPSSPAHNFLFEGLDQCQFENIVSRNGNWGLVMKTTASTSVGVTSYNCSTAGFTFKSDTGVNGTPALRSSASNILIDNSGYPAAAQGILIFAATSSLADIMINNYQTRGGDVGVKIVCDSRATNVNLIRDVVMNNGIIEDAVTFGFDSFGAISNVLINNLDIRNTASKKSMRVMSDCLGIELNNVTCSAPAADILNVDLSGRFSFNGLRSCVNGDYASPSGINLTPDGAATFKIGTYLGTLGFSGVQGWTPTISGLTTGGSGGVTVTGSYNIIGKLLKFRAQISVTGTATTASTAGITILNNLPFQPLQNDICNAISGTVTQGGVGFIQAGTQNVYLPNWTAYNGTFVISGQYFFQT